jgi:dihydropteroate synthase
MAMACRGLSLIRREKAIVPHILSLPDGRHIELGTRPLVMGIINVTPDSFSDGGDYLEQNNALAHGLIMADEGADILDVGGESTRPGHVPVSTEDEIARVIPLIKALHQRSTCPLSVDTMKARVAEAALDAGAVIVNDVWGLQHDRDMARVVAERGAPVIIMHNRGSEDPSLDIVRDVIDFLSRSLDIALKAGVLQSQIIVDPGFGFAKTHEQSLRLVRELPALKILGCPILLGVSRKRAIGVATLQTEPKKRMIGSLTTALIGVNQGAAIVRVHDVAPHVEALLMYGAIYPAQGDGK